MFAEDTAPIVNLSVAAINEPAQFVKTVGGQDEYKRLHKAMLLDLEAALKATSWGGYQILGVNHEYCGFQDVFTFVNAMKHSELGQLMAFVEYVKSRKLDKYVREKDWAGFAKRYNGPSYAVNKYDEKLAAAYKSFGGQ